MEGSLDLTSSDLQKLLGKASDISIRSGVSGASLTTMAVGGDVDWLIEPQSEKELSAVLRALSGEGIPFRIIGAGSNIVIPDRGIHVPVIRLGRGFRETEINGAKVKAGGSVSLMQLSRAASEAGLEGFEFAGGIPASVGGAVRMNAGAHGGEISSVLEWVRYILPTGEAQSVKASTLAFSYRKAGIPEGAVVIEATFKLVPGDKVTSDARRSQFLAERKAHQPLTLPSSGSVFRNPDRDRTAGRLLDECGAKGMKKGGVMVSDLHANWIVNPKKDGRASEVVWLVSECQKLAKEKAKVHLEPEIIIWD